MYRRRFVLCLDVRSLDGLGDVRTSLSAASVAGMSAASPGTRSFVASLGTPMVALSIAGTFFIASIALPATAARKNARGVRGSRSSVADGRTWRLLRPGPPRVSCNPTGSTLVELRGGQWEVRGRNVQGVGVRAGLCAVRGGQPEEDEHHEHNGWAGWKLCGIVEDIFGKTDLLQNSFVLDWPEVA